MCLKQLFYLNTLFGGMQILWLACLKHEQNVENENTKGDPWVFLVVLSKNVKGFWELTKNSDP